MSDRTPSTRVRGRSYGAFLRAFFRDRRTIGAVAPTSRGVARRIARLAAVERAQRMVEFGAGTGAITSELLAAMPDDGRLWAYEIHPPFVQHLRAAVGDPRFNVLETSAEAIGELRDREAPDGFDAIVSSIPFSLIGPEQTPVILRAARKALRPGGRFVALQYHPRFLAPFLRDEFGRIEREVYPWNIPPATLLSARRD